MGKGIVLLILISTVAACGPGANMTGATFNKPSIFIDPSPVAPPTEQPDQDESDVEQAVGLYWQGSLINAVNVGLSGRGYIKIFRGRDSGWATEDLLGVIDKGITVLENKYSNQEPLQIGDIAHEFGGPIGSHASHQNGLDADIRLLSKNHHVQTESAPTDFSDTGFDEPFVIKGKLSTDFDLERNWELVKALVATGKINRILVDSVIKKGLCNYSKSIGEKTTYADALRALEPWTDHVDHMHVRITCPENSPRCLTQDPLPPGTGCSALNGQQTSSPD